MQVLCDYGSAFKPAGVLELGQARRLAAPHACTACPTLPVPALHTTASRTSWWPATWRTCGTVCWSESTGDGTELLVDSEGRVRTSSCCDSRLCPPKLYCTFQNGLCYEYMRGAWPWGRAHP